MRAKVDPSLNLFHNDVKFDDTRTDDEEVEKGQAKEERKEKMSPTAAAT
jgi:hypothetical protein